jgi:hypothetical protein
MNNMWAIDFANTVAWYANFVLAGSIVIATLLFRFLSRKPA